MSAAANRDQGTPKPGAASSDPGLPLRSLRPPLDPGALTFVPDHEKNRHRRGGSVVLRVTNTDEVGDFIRGGGIQVAPGLAKPEGTAPKPAAAIETGKDPAEAVAALERVKHLGTDKLLSDVDTLTRRQMRNFLASLGCKKISWKCEVLKKQMKAVVLKLNCNGSVIEKAALRNAADDAHTTQRELKQKAIDKIQASFFPTTAPALHYVHRTPPSHAPGPSQIWAAPHVARNKEDGALPQKKRERPDQDPEQNREEVAKIASSMAATLKPKNVSESEVLGSKVLGPEDLGSKKICTVEELTANAEALTRSQMRHFLAQLGLDKPSWKCETLRNQIKAVIIAREKGEKDLKKVAKDCGINQAIDSIQNRFNCASGVKPASPLSPPSPMPALIQRREEMRENLERGPSAAALEQLKVQKVVRGDERDHGEVVKKLMKTMEPTTMDSLMTYTFSRTAPPPLSPLQQRQQHQQHCQQQTPAKTPEQILAAKYKGVTWSKLSGKFEAHKLEFYENGEGKRKTRQVFVGQFDCAEAAARAYDRSLTGDKQEQLRELIKLRDRRTKQSISQVLGLNFDP